MNQRNALVEALKEEDRLLRGYVTRVPRALRERRSPDGGLSLKEILGHIAYWDDFTVRFFRCRIDTTRMTLPPPVRFEERSRAELRRMGPLPFGEVLARYLEATGALLAFLEGHWGDLTEREKADFWVPLKHRRHHRLRFALAFGLGDGAETGGALRMAEGA